MGTTEKPRQQTPGQGDRRGFTLIELLLVTVILGVLASIVSPYFDAARERAVAAMMQTDLRNMMEGVEIYSLLNDGAFPSSVEDLVEKSTYNQTEEVEYCMFTPVPPSTFREGYVMVLVGHASTSLKMFVVYPLWGNTVLEFNTGTRGC